MSEKTVTVPAISCGHCLMTIQREVGEISGVTSVSGETASKKVTIAWEEPADWGRIADRLREIGYPAQE